MREFVASIVIYLGALASAQGGPLHDAAKTGDLAAIAAALDSGADIEEQEKGTTPLFLAVRSGQRQAAELLIERGADVNKEAKLGLPITVAVLKNSVDMIRLLLAHGASPNTAARGEPDAASRGRQWLPRLRDGARRSRRRRQRHLDKG